MILKGIAIIGILVEYVLIQATYASTLTIYKGHLFVELQFVSKVFIAKGQRAVVLAIAIVEAIGLAFTIVLSAQISVLLIGSLTKGCTHFRNCKYIHT